MADHQTDTCLKHGVRSDGISRFFRLKAALRAKFLALAAFFLAFAWGLPEAKGQIGPELSGPMPPPAANPAEKNPSPLPVAAPAEMVVDVRIAGNKSLPLEKILPQIKTRPGRPLDTELVEEDVRRLDHTHQFINVRTFFQKVAGGQVVIFDVMERPLLQEEPMFDGCYYIRKKRLQKESELKKNDPVDTIVIEDARRKVEEYYHKQGFSNARVTLLEGNKPEDRRAIFLINEGVKQKIWKTNFVGNTIDSADRLRTQIKSSRPFLFLFGGEMDHKQIEEDVERLTAYYRGLGFFDARISREVEYNEKMNWVTVTFVIDEGTRFKIRNVSVIGNTKYSNEQLLTNFEIRSGDYFNQSKVSADQNSLLDKYGSVGYAFAKIEPTPRYLEEGEHGQLDLVYNIREGDRYRVGKLNVQIKGDYAHTQVYPVLNRLSIKPGDIVDIREIRASERRLRACGLFESNPAQGNVPRIVFSPPGQENEDPEESGKTQVAERPNSGRRRGGFRGQSPDDPSRDRVLDLTYDCGRYVGPAESTGDTKLSKGTVPFSSNENRDSSPLAVPFSSNENRNSPLPAREQVAPVAADPTADSDLLKATRELTEALGQRQPERKSRKNVIETQYSPNAGQTNPAVYPQTRWTGNATAADASNAAQQPQGVAAEPANVPPPSTQYSPQPSTQPAPVQPSPAYGQQMLPRDGSDQPVQPNLGQPMPGPISSGTAPFLNGAPDGSDFARSLPMGIPLNETMTGRLMFGVGINSDAGLVGSIVLDEQNFNWARFPSSWEDIRDGEAWRGAGQRFRIEAVPGTQVQRYMVNFQEPFMFGTQNSLGLSGYYYNRIFTDWTEQRLGGRVAIGRQFTPDFSGTLAYEGAKINITNPIDPFLPALAAVTGRDLAMHSFTATLTEDKRDNAFMATEGFLIQGSIGEVLGSFTYPRAEIDARKYFTLFERPDGSGRQVLSFGAHAGYTGDNTPIYDRFFAGGFSSLRGFQFRGASPHEYSYYAGTDVFVGGNFEMLASAEYLFPITADDMLRGVVFCDTGTVEPKINNWTDKFRVAPGFGLRIVVPAMGPAPIALDFAFPVSWQPGDRHEMFSFFVGYNH